MPVLGVTIHGSHYALFGPDGSTWTGLGPKSLTNHIEAARTISRWPCCPTRTRRRWPCSRSTLTAHVTDTRVTWSYSAQDSSVTSTFTLVTKAYEGDQQGTLFALYPHQWHNSSDTLSPLEYASVRGTMKLGEGKWFTTKLRYPGVLPALPKTDGLRFQAACHLSASRGRGQRSAAQGHLLGRQATGSGGHADSHRRGVWVGHAGSSVAKAFANAAGAMVHCDRQQRRARRTRACSTTTSRGAR